jgi:NAD(P)-dependent dehydrogenase (short-subunit alcohol dehydrogenase family)
MSTPLAERVAIVSGASSGIGASIAEQMAQAGARIVLTGRDEGRLEDVARRIRAEGGECATVAADLRDEDAPAQIVDGTLAAYGTLNGLIHSAGLYWPRGFADMPLSELDEQWHVNLRAPFALTQTALPHLGEGSFVVFISSQLGAIGAPDSTAYCATKGAVEQLTRALAIELAPAGIRVNCIAPGAIHSPMNAGLRAADPTLEAALSERTPAGRWGEVDEIAPAAVFLSSEAASYMHGAILRIDGGTTAQ